MYTSTVLGEGKCVLFREVSLIQGCPIREVSLYTHTLRGRPSPGVPGESGEVST